MTLTNRIAFGDQGRARAHSASVVSAAKTMALRKMKAAVMTAASAPIARRVLVVMAWSPKRMNVTL